MSRGLDQVNFEGKGVETIHRPSAYADADGLLLWLGTAARPPERALVIHGDAEPAAPREADPEGPWMEQARVPSCRDRAALDRPGDAGRTGRGVAG